MSRISLSIDKEADSILLSNRNKFKKIFSKHLPNREGRITIQEFLKFCSNVRILQVTKNQDLISPIDLKKTIAQQNLKNCINYLEFEMLIKQIALQTFNNTAPLYDKLRMLMIHIRNSCKMHYQVSLNQNYNKEALDFEAMQEPVEIEGPIEELSKPVEVNDRFLQNRYLGMSCLNGGNNFHSVTSVSPVRDNDAKFKARTRGKNEKSVSPSNSIEILEKALNYKFSFKSNRNSKNLNDLARRVSVSPYRSVSPVDLQRLSEVKKSFERFRTSFSSAVKTPPKSFTAKRISAQLNYIKTLRKNTFQNKFVLKLIFTSWKRAARDKLLRVD